MIIDHYRAIGHPQFVPICRDVGLYCPFHIKSRFGMVHRNEGARLPPYHFSVTVGDDFSSTVTKTKQALADHGFGIVCEVDMTEIFREKLGVERPPHLILGTCNPEFAQRALAVDPAISVLLPCHVVVRSTEGDRVVVDFIDPAVLVELTGEPSVRDIADEVRTRFEMVRDTVATAALAAV